MKLDSKIKESDQDSIDEKWTSFTDTVYSAARGVLGPLLDSQDWFYENDSNIHALLEEKPPPAPRTPERSLK